MEATQTLPNGTTQTSTLPRPYFVRGATGSRAFGSLAAARRYARTVGTYSIFFDYAPGCGRFIESSNTSNT